VIATATQPTRKTPTLRRLLRDYGVKVWDDALVGEWFDPAYHAALKKELTATKVDLNDHLDEIIASFIQRDIADRAHRPIFIEDDKGLWQPSMFTEDIARQSVIRLGNGARIKPYEATGPHWYSHFIQQQKAISRAVLAMDKTSRWLECSVGQLLTTNPTLKTFEAMRKLGFWEIPDESTENDARADYDAALEQEDRE
jgi:hypothetical protein